MHITKWGEYGLLCCLYLARKYESGEAIGAAEIAETQRVPLQYTQQILHRLRKGDIIQSVRGPHGGFKLTKSPQDTNLKDVLRAAEGATFEVICDHNPLYEDTCAPNAECGLKDVWYDLRDAIDKVLESRTLAGVLEKHKIFHDRLVSIQSKASAVASPTAAIE